MAIGIARCIARESDLTPIANRKVPPQSLYHPNGGPKCIKPYTHISLPLFISTYIDICIHIHICICMGNGNT